MGNVPLRFRLGLVCATSSNRVEAKPEKRFAMFRNGSPAKYGNGPLSPRLRNAIRLVTALKKAGRVLHPDPPPAIRPGGGPIAQSGWRRWAIWRSTGFEFGTELDAPAGPKRVPTSTSCLC